MCNNTLSKLTTASSLLESVNFNFHMHTGTIPSEIGLTALAQILMTDNMLTGTLPSEIGMLTNLGKIIFVTCWHCGLPLYRQLLLLLLVSLIR